MRIYLLKEEFSVSKIYTFLIAQDMAYTMSTRNQNSNKNKHPESSIYNDTIMYGHDTVCLRGSYPQFLYCTEMEPMQLRKAWPVVVKSITKVFDSLRGTRSSTMTRPYIMLPLCMAIIAYNSAASYPQFIYCIEMGPMQLTKAWHK